MIRFLSKFGISVYEGISPSLLATMSLSQGIGGKTNEEMVQSLVKSNIITNKHLIQSMKEINRANFTSDPQPYMNKPYKISGKENMTDIFTHSVILQNICHYVINQSKILDIGTGHGYLPFVIHHFKNSSNITGIDSNQLAIQNCNKLKNSNHDNLKFQSGFIHDFLDAHQNQKWNIIIGGFYITPSLEALLIDRLINSEESMGIWASDHPDGQALFKYTFDNNNNIKKQYVMSTLFSEPCVKTNVSKYFLENEESQENEANKVDEEEVKRLLYEEKVRQKKKSEQELKNKLKVLILKFSKQKGKKLSLTEMREIPQINDILKRLN